MKKAGCANILFGVETGSTRTRKSIGKDIANRDFIDVFRTCRKIGINTYATFIIGLPGTTYEKDLKMLEWANKHRLNAHFSYYVPREGELPVDCLFYGEVAEPKADTYPHEQQKELYEMTKARRAGGGENLNLFQRGIRKLKRVLWNR